MQTEIEPETPVPDFIVIPKSSPKNSPPNLPPRDLSGRNKISENGTMISKPLNISDAINVLKISESISRSFDASKISPKNISQLSSDNSILNTKFFSFINSNKAISPDFSSPVKEPITSLDVDSTPDEPMSLDELKTPVKESRHFQEYTSPDIDRRKSIPLPSEGGIRTKIARVTEQSRPITKSATVPKLYIKEESHCPLMLCVMIESSQEALCYLYIESSTKLWDIRKFLCTSPVVRGNIPTGFSNFYLNYFFYVSFYS